MWRRRGSVSPIREITFCEQELNWLIDINASKITCYTASIMHVQYSVRNYVIVNFMITDTFMHMHVVYRDKTRKEKIDKHLKTKLYMYTQTNTNFKSQLCIIHSKTTFRECKRQ